MEKYNWNNSICERAFVRLEEDLKRRNLPIDINYPYLDELSKQTHSKKIISLIEKSYYLGMARGIKSIDEGMTIITPSKSK